MDNKQIEIIVDPEEIKQEVKMYLVMDYSKECRRPLSIPRVETDFRRNRKYYQETTKQKGTGPSAITNELWKHFYFSMKFPMITFINKIAN
ncbi:hypothetical protein Glove_97g124 [Diversispora epigaea]|uniref:Uncharacterized protein n=1 Tax=Diversispora epigaea TaxID=1348612 RepID=A0A397J5F3_9GLOM|nr:hypothetical protein Glove_97g124 [Diversispora epigaea]